MQYMPSVPQGASAESNLFPELALNKATVCLVKQLCLIHK